MALTIRSIPVLKAQEASVFVSNATAQSSKKATIDFSKQSEQASKILAKAKLK
ncbi:hypothetical protein PBAC_29140 [Pedobacter glucosidilyticus]|nr:hypothetical protein [Pedobacter glucosidilyticus]KHJ36879.1 hypothetical protein PBAC_29140 [Pedobacter glucosidilyticus]